MFVSVETRIRLEGKGFAGLPKEIDAPKKGYSYGQTFAYVFELLHNLEMKHSLMCIHKFTSNENSLYEEIEEELFGADEDNL